MPVEAAFRKDTFREPLDRVVGTLQDSARRLERIGDDRLEENSANSDRIA